MNPEQPVIFVVDDDVSILDALRNLLRSVGLRVEVFGTAQEFLSSNRTGDHGCLVLDVRLPGMSGLDLQNQLAGAKLQMPIIFLTGYGDVPMSVRAMKAGAFEFLTKPFRDQEILDAVHAAIERDRQRREQQREVRIMQEKYDSLTPRERDVLRLIIQGMVNKQIGDVLNISEPTVKMHRGRLMHKMEVDSLAELIHTMAKLGIFPGNERPGVAQ